MCPLSASQSFPNLLEIKPWTLPTFHTLPLSSATPCMLTLGDKQEFEARIWSSACTRGKVSNFPKEPSVTCHKTSGRERRGFAGTLWITQLSLREGNKVESFLNCKRKPLEVQLSSQNYSNEKRWNCNQMTWRNPSDTEDNAVHLTMLESCAMQLKCQNKLWKQAPQLNST